LHGYEALNSKLIDSYNIKYLKPGDHKSLIDYEFFDFLKEILEVELTNINAMDFKVVMNISAIRNSENIVRIGKMFLEDLNFKAFALINSASLALFSTGRTSGLVVDCGETRSYIVPVYEGFPLYHALNKNRIGGRDITRVFSEGIIEEGLNVKPYDLKNLRAIKEKTSSVPYLKDYESYLNTDWDIIPPEKMLYKLPDSNEIISIPKHLRIKASELLFT
jgi:actin-related protein